MVHVASRAAGFSDPASQEQHMSPGKAQKPVLLDVMHFFFNGGSEKHADIDNLPTQTHKISSYSSCIYTFCPLDGAPLYS